MNEQIKIIVIKIKQHEATQIRVESLPTTKCAKINYAILTSHDKSYIGPISKIYEQSLAKDLKLDASICVHFLVFY